MQDVGRVVTMQSSPEEKIRLFRTMFCGREDGVSAGMRESGIWGVCPKCATFGRGGAKKVPISCAECSVRQFEEISDRVVANHLRGSDEKDAYRRDRRKDELLQGEGYFVLRFLSRRRDVGSRQRH